MYVYAHLKLWLKDSVIGTFKRGLSSESENCADLETRAALRMDHAGQSLQEGDLVESIRLADDMLKSAPHSSH